MHRSGIASSDDSCLWSTPHVQPPFISGLLGILEFWKGNIPHDVNWMLTQQSFKNPFGNPTATEASSVDDNRKNN